MSSCVIFKKDLKNLGKRLMKEFYLNIYDKVLLNQVEEYQLKRKFYDENFVNEFLSFHKNEEKKFGNLYFGDKRYSDLLEMEPEILLRKIEEKIEDETLDIEIIYNFFNDMDRKLNIDRQIDFEIDEDLFYKKKAFINIYNVFYTDYKELNNIKPLTSRVIRLPSFTLDNNKVAKIPPFTLHREPPC